MNTFLKIFVISGLVLCSAILFSAIIAPQAAKASTINFSGSVNALEAPFSKAGQQCARSPILISNNLHPGDMLELNAITGNYCTRYETAGTCVWNTYYGCEEGFLHNCTDGGAVQIGFYNNATVLIQQVPVSAALNSAISVPAGATSAYIYVVDIDGYYFDNNGAYKCDFSGNINSPTPSCISHDSKKCVGSVVYWFDSCGVQQDLFQQCTTSQTCTNAQCIYSCSPNASKRCVGNSVYNFDSCGNQGTLYQQCTTSQTCSGGSCGNIICPLYCVYVCGADGRTYCNSCLAIQAGTNVVSQGQCPSPNITCSSNTQCGTNTYTGSPYCSSNNVYQNYITYTCNNAGTPSSYCSNNTASQLKTTCTGNQICSGGSCTNQTITCTANTDCGTNAYIGSPFCQGNNVYQNYITYTCNNPGTGTSYCSNNTAPQLKTTCTGNQTCSNGSCGTNCTQNSYQQCQGNYLYWYDSCGNQQGQAQYCPNGCAGNICVYLNPCTSNSYEQCVGNNLYWYNSCGVQQSLIQYCQNGCSGSACTNNNNCTQNSYQRCSGNYLYWYDSCGNQESQSQYCQNGCYNNSCSYTPYNPYGNCTYHAYKLCVGNNIYWYDSCGGQQDLFQTCAGVNTTCQYGICTISYQQIIVPIVYNPSYVAHYKTACYSNNLYWYDSLGRANTLYKSCADSNSCTLDSCIGGQCSNTIKCDGTTCAAGSADYNNYCSSNNNSNTNNNNNNSSNNSNNNNNNVSNNVSTLSVSFFAKQDQNSTQWQKTVQVGSNGQVYFMISVVNNSASQVNNVNISANIPNEVTSLGNLQINGVLVSGDIVSGVSIGSLTPGGAKSITFEGKTQTISTQATEQAVATSNVSTGPAQSDSVSINLIPSQAAAASVSSTQSTSGFWAFLKRWYLWILVALVLIFLFVVVFRRLSSNA